MIAGLKSLQIRESRKGGLPLDPPVQFNWQLAPADKHPSLAELQELVRLKSNRVKVRGQWAQLIAAEIQFALNFWKKKAGVETTAREILQMTLGGVKKFAVPRRNQLKPPGRAPKTKEPTRVRKRIVKKPRKTIS
ncbi:MAG: hypothetical protein FJ134_07580 [Deltaproteobacteria bacterium]|nr:hypothetical protein [Deltaproteobacteria bacterium]